MNVVAGQHKSRVFSPPVSASVARHDHYHVLVLGQVQDEITDLYNLLLAYQNGLLKPQA